MKGHQIGREGEKAAADYLCQNGYTLIERNYRTPTAEIDIIARQDDFLCFVEVKTRTSLKKGLPRESVHYKKQQKIISGASFYLKKNRLFNHRIRFDVVEILLSTDQDQHPEITLIKNAFGTV
jgi:putative endonuclease